MKSRNVTRSSREYVELKRLWSNHMKNKNPLFEEANKLKIKNALTGRTKETHDYIKQANIKKSQYNVKNSQWLKESRIKFKKTIDAMSEQERKDKFGHEMSDESKLKLSLARRGMTKDNCERVRKISETIKKNNNLLSDEEVKAKYSRTIGMRWYYSDNQKASKLMLPINVTGDWRLGRKKYENKEN